MLPEFGLSSIVRGKGLEGLGMAWTELDGLEGEAGKSWKVLEWFGGAWRGLVGLGWPWKVLEGLGRSRKGLERLGRALGGLGMA